MEKRVKNVEELGNLLYDKLADNTEMDMFDSHWTDDMCLINDKGTMRIAFIIDDDEYVLTLEKNPKGNYKFYKNEGE